MKPPEPIRVLIVEDHPLFRQGLRNALEDDDGIRVVAEADTVTLGLQAIEKHRPEVVLVDLKLPGEDGLTLVRHLRDIGYQGAGTRPPRPIVLSAHDFPQDVRAALDAGAAGYLLKEEPAERIVAAVKAAAGGREPVVSRRAEKRLREWHLDGLTQKEQEVVRLLADGRALPQIAEALTISLRTVRNHLANVYGKLDLHSQSEVVAWAWKQGQARRDAP